MRYGSPGTTDGYTTIAYNTVQDCDGNAIIAQNNKDSIIGNVIKGYGLANGALIGFDGAIALLVNAGTKNLVAHHTVDSVGHAVANPPQTPAGLYMAQGPGGNWVFGNVLQNGEQNYLNGADRGMPTLGLEVYEAGSLGAGGPRQGVSSLSGGTVTVSTKRSPPKVASSSALKITTRPARCGSARERLGPASRSPRATPAMVGPSRGRSATPVSVSVNSGP